MLKWWLIRCQTVLFGICSIPQTIGTFIWILKYVFFLLNFILKACNFPAQEAKVRVKSFSNILGFQSTGTGCLERSWSCLLWRCSSSIWTCSYTMYSGEPVLAGSWTWWSPEVLSNPDDSVLCFQIHPETSCFLPKSPLNTGHWNKEAGCFNSLLDTWKLSSMTVSGRIL